MNDIPTDARLQRGLQRNAEIPVSVELPSVPTAPARMVRPAFGARSAAEALGEIHRGVEVFGLSSGAFGVSDVLEYCLAATGPADLTVCTWTVGRRDVFRTARLLTGGLVTSLRLVADRSLPQRQPEYHAALVERYGPGSVCLSSVHAKFCVISNRAWHLVLRTSSNLDEVRRLEWFELSDDPSMAAYLLDTVDQLFEAQLVGLTFEQFVEAQRPPARKYFGSGVLDADLRRAGWTFADTGKGLAE